MPVAVTTETPGMFRADNATVSSKSAVTIKAFLFTDNASNTLTNSFVFGASKANWSTTTNSSACTFDESADNNAKRRTFLGNW